MTKPPKEPCQPAPSLWRMLVISWHLREWARRDREAFLQCQGDASAPPREPIDR